MFLARHAALVACWYAVLWDNERASAALWVSRAVASKVDSIYSKAVLYNRRLSCDFHFSYILKFWPLINLNQSVFSHTLRCEQGKKKWKSYVCKLNTRYNSLEPGCLQLAWNHKVFNLAQPGLIVGSRFDSTTSLACRELWCDGWVYVMSNFCLLDPAAEGVRGLQPGLARW